MYAYMYNRRMNAILTKVPKTLGVSEFRAGLADHLAAAKRAPVIVSDRRGGGTFVLLDEDVYNKLLDAWEDIEDGKELARLIKANKGKKFIPWEKVR